ncbi:hypothetical protein KC318_g3230 [Hortaea werneckii]|nr:hypothetical protein KC334_g3411 [Hortaea werneckii]KAI7018871.1 hypothetical protein KC355_g3219 [Hortaea werneckii]KAI7199979.1 hypothetical protein KC324_g2966 [Hortaea werneckii]KAI7591360.1 hypothetical protein KC316_g2913 [Hortaea werneckii]KAI7671838.1 hypothetical protein KC318_g3230 [Hortaea werneckii]
MGDDKSASVYVAVHHGKTPSARLPELFDAYKLDDYLVDEHAENIIMNSIIMLGSDRGSIDEIDVNYVMTYMPMNSFGEYEREMLDFVAATELPCSSTKSKVAQFIARSQSTVSRHDRQ